MCAKCLKLWVTFKYNTYVKIYRTCNNNVTLARDKGHRLVNVVRRFGD